MSGPVYAAGPRLRDIKARKGHLCQGGRFDLRDGPVCGCGTFLEGLPDFMDLPPDAQRDVQRDVQRMLGKQSTHEPNDEPPMVSGDDVPPAPFRHASGEPCYGCQSCFAEIESDGVLDEAQPDLCGAWPSRGGCVLPAGHNQGQADVPDAHVFAFEPVGDSVDIMAQADAVEAAGAAVAHRAGTPDMAPAVPVVDPTQPYGPAEVERAILDSNRRLELGLKHEANLIAAADQMKVEYELKYARAIERSAGGAADIRKANATLAAEREYRAWREAVAARDAMKSITHTLRSTLSALQSVGRSVGVSYTAPQGRGR